MTRRTRHLRRKRTARPFQDWRFFVAVTVVAVITFYVVLTWPPGQGALPLVAQPLQVPAASRPNLVCTVASVTDGDTLRCRDGIRIRLHAVAAREADERCAQGHPCPVASGAAATRELRRLVSGRTLACEPTGRSYDRVTAICWTPSGEEVNCAMVRSGTALLWTRFDRERPLCRSTG